MRIYLGGHFRFYILNHPEWVETLVEGPTPLCAVLARLGIPPAEVHLAAVNGEAVDPAEAVVKEGDEVKLYPPMDGG